MIQYSVTREPNSYYGADWSNLTNLKFSDDQYASVLIDTVTTYFILYNFGFAIPSDAIINGIEVLIEAHADTDNALSISSALLGFYDGSSFKIKGFQRENVTAWTTIDDIYTVGDTSDLWDTTWTYDDINQSSFGCAIEIYNTSSSAVTAYVDYVCITIACTISSGTTYQLSASIPLQTTFTPRLNINKKISSLVSCGTSLNGILKRFAGLKASIYGITSFGGALTRFAGLQVYILCSTVVSSLVRIYRGLSSTIGGTTQTSFVLKLQKGLNAVVQSSTSFVSDLLIVGKLLLNAIVSTGTSIVSGIRVNYAINSVISCKTQISPFVSIKRALSGTFSSKTTLSGLVGVIRKIVSTISTQTTLTANVGAIRGLVGNITTKTTLTTSLVVNKVFSAVITGKTTITSNIQKIRMLTGLVISKTTLQAQLISVQLLNAVISSATQMKASLKKTIRMFASFAGKTIFVAISTFWSRVKMYPATWQQKNREVETWKRIK